MNKKLILCSILAIAVGIATIIPLGYLMGAEAQFNREEVVKAMLPAVESWFKVDIPYAYCNPYKSIGNYSVTLDGAIIQIVANFTVNSDALKEADAQIEYYQFAVSSDEGPITSLGYYVLLDKGGVTAGVSGNGTIWFTNGLVYNGPASNGGQGLNYDALDRNFTTGFVSSYMFGVNNENLPEAVAKLRSAQVLYVDVTKVCTVTVKGNVTVTTPASDELLGHIELSKVDSNFVYGSYVEGTLPLPVEKP